MARRTKIVGVETIRPFALDSLDLGIAQTRLKRADHAQGDVVLECKYVVELAVIAFRPEMRAAFGLDQLGADPYALARLANASLQHISHAQVAPRLFGVYGPTLVGKARIVRDDEQPFDAGEPSDDVFHHSVGEVVLLRIAAQVLERQKGDRGLVGQCQWRGRWRIGRRYREAALGDLDGPDITVAAARQRFDPLFAAGLLAEHSPQSRDLNAQIAVFDRETW